MHFRWYHAVMLIVALCCFGVGTLWLASPKDEKEPPKAKTAAETDLFLRTNQLITDEEALKRNPETAPNATRTLALLKGNEKMEEYFQTPEGKRFLEVLTSPEFYEFEKTNPNTKETDAFWAKHGFVQDPDRFTKKFREEFPTGEPKDFEPEMRAKLEELFAEIPPDQYLDNMHSLVEHFISDKRNNAWLKGYFQGDSSGGWAETILEDLATSYPQRMAQNVLPARDTPPMDAATPPMPQPDAAFESLTPLELPIHNGGKDSTAENIQDSPVHPENTYEPPEILTGDSLELLELPTEENIAAQLRAELDPERFSPQRLNTAMETLNRYGPQEGLRKLKESDPEVAALVERTLLKPPEEE